MTSLFDLTNEVAVVIGATGVLGGALADGLAAAGATVAVVGRNAGRGEARVAAIRSAGGTAQFFTADAMETASLAAAHTAIRQHARMAWVGALPAVFADALHLHILFLPAQKIKPARVLPKVPLAEVDPGPIPDTEPLATLVSPLTEFVHLESFERDHFGPKRTTGARALRGVEAHGLCALRDLRLRAVG